ncbi:FAD-dependent oxidoreductase [Caulobacter mirabilis]|uniref:FAD-dependent oxidoreductase n=2 Tax=Caulobacter mirabilis TaxID=69666 RepID=A0A2D2B460_9CAUL|nr:FAD-dependent oxidoreductase [Caulobacter mirabilis]
MAGVSAASHLATDLAVVVLEQEVQAGFHATGRSAALFSEVYGNRVVRALSRASRPVLFGDDESFCTTPLARSRGSLWIGRRDQVAALSAFAALPDIAPATHELDARETAALFPILRADYAVRGLLEPSASDIDVDALHQAYIRAFRRRGGRLITDARVDALSREGTRWRVRFGAESILADVVVNAAGAWADEVAALAGVQGVGIRPHRRTALLVDAPAARDIDDWPMAIDIDETFYIKPDAGRLLLSPADETPSPPCDAQPEDWDVAVAVDRVQTATTLECRRIVAKWAGLRSFAPDRSPVVGYDETSPGFFWLAGQGGYGIQTAPALARIADSLVRHRGIPEDLGADVSSFDLSPSRPRHSAD